MPEMIAPNPYDITGVSRQSEEAQSIGMDYVHAQAAARELGNFTPDQVSALLYAGSRGDSSAMKQYKNLASEGQKLVSTAKNDPSRLDEITNLQNRLREAQAMPDTPETSQRKKNIINSIERQLREIEAEGQQRGLHSLGDAAQIDTSKILLTHEKDLSFGGFEIDDEGNLHLRPLGDFEATDTLLAHDDGVAKDGRTRSQ
jgi:hypothetical protein